MQGDRLKCVLMGDGSLLTQCGGVLIERGHEISAVVTANDDVRIWAESQGVPLYASDEAIQNGLVGVSFDWFFSIANLRLLPAHLWQSARCGAANFHDGPLPRHAGLNAPAWAILQGDARYGVTWHAITSGIDEGDIYAQRHFDIASDETSLTLNMKCFEAGLEAFGELIARITAGTLVPVPQDLSARTYHARDDRPAAAGLLDPEAGAGEIDRLARAMNFGAGYANPLCLLKLRTSRATYNIQDVRIAEAASTAPPGTVISSDARSAVIAVRDGAVRLSGLTTAYGAPVAPADVLSPGERLPPLSREEAREIDAVMRDVARHEGFFRRRLQNFQDFELYSLNAPIDGTVPRWEEMAFELPPGLSGTRAIAALVASLARLSGKDRLDAFYADGALSARAQRAAGAICATVPLSVSVPREATPAVFSTMLEQELDGLQRRAGYAIDLVNRTPHMGIARSNLAIVAHENAAAAAPVPETALTFVVPTTGTAGRLLFDASRLEATSASMLMRRLGIALAAFQAHEAETVSMLPLMGAEELDRLLNARNATARAYDRTQSVPSLFEAQVTATPEAIALVFGDESLSYRQLNDRANSVAAYLATLGVGPDSLVGLNVTRSADLVIGALGIMKAGGAYVPLDPSYPADRIAYMIEDSGLKTLIVDGPMLATTSYPGVRALTVSQALNAPPAEAVPIQGAAPHNLAYVIYTSGSTGRPKGVMIEHRNVVNFFIGMDERIPRPAQGQGIWLAVTSLSFDISVLELFWTLARGFKVVIMPDEHYQPDAAARPGRGAAGRSIDFGLFYWGDDAAAGANKYRLLLDGARFADQNGFTAVWTPERHFHAFGGPYPNPAVTGAAVAAITQNVSIRAGSCVLPLHHPARVAEEWSVVDNLSNGRVAVAFASGWMPEDFILRPENAPPQNKSAMFRDIDIVRKLWRGQKVTFDGPTGAIEVMTQPRPVQSELPVWVTTAGNIDTFREAARHGANILTHLLGQSVREVGEKIAAYREELQSAGRDPSQYKVTLMLHTLVGHDRDVVREQAREPMKRYLKSAAALIKQYAWAFPAFKRPQGVERPVDLDLRTLDDEELDGVIEFAFQRYFEDSGLFGTLDDALARVDQLRAIGVDEIACLVDFGVPAEVAYEALVPLADVIKRVKAATPVAYSAAASPARPREDERAGALIKRHGVTHLQCTPAMASMLLENDEDRAALASVRHLFIGGEALQGPLLKQLRQATAASIENMYGPTETTIWSTTGPALDTDGNVPLGTPIANTQLYVLDDQQRPVPPGFPGELVIGGDGVVRGYLGRPELTAERFLPNPFIPGARMYRTGDLVRIAEDGELHFIGRNDHQVKVRGHRIELGEIENALGAHADISQAVVLVREDIPGDLRIVAYVRFKGPQLSDEDMRSHVRQSLPEFMVPSAFVPMEQFPLTPNLKVDRKRLPKPSRSAPAAAPSFEAPSGELELRIADVFKGVLGVDRIGMKDNFFDLGGHSLLAVQAHRKLKETIAPKLSITDLYRFPTIYGIAEHLRDAESGNKNLDKIAQRAAERRAALTSRRTALRPTR